MKPPFGQLPKKSVNFWLHLCRSGIICHNIKGLTACLDSAYPAYGWKIEQASTSHGKNPSMKFQHLILFYRSSVWTPCGTLLFRDTFSGLSFPRCWGADDLGQLFWICALRFASPYFPNLPPMDTSNLGIRVIQNSQRRSVFRLWKFYNAQFLWLWYDVKT